MAGLCVFVPLVGLLLFLGISLIHFSEGELHATVPPAVVLGSLLAFSAILLPIGLHPDLAQLYLRFFVPRDLLDAMEKPLLFAASTAALMLSTMILAAIYHERGAARAEAVQRLLCLLAWIILPPLSGFAVWFIGRHSRQHLEVCHALFTEGRFRVPIDFLVISALAMVGLLPFTLLFDFSRIEEVFAAAICLIAGLTLPHMVVSHRIRDVKPT
jgi:Brp/Blh family beta-carotene 15,15'-monooxygenase